MRVLVVVFGLLFFNLTNFSAIAQSQDHAAHHPDQTRAVQADTSAGHGMMGSGMMSGGMMGSGSGMMGGKGMMKCGQMGGKGMMHGKGKMGSHGPLHRYMHIVHHLPGMKAELGLSDDQLDQIKNIQSDFLKQNIDWKADIEKRQIDLGLLLDKEGTVTDVRKALKPISNVKLEQKVAYYETARKMLSLLTAEQKEKVQDSCPMCKGDGKMMGMMGD